MQDAARGLSIELQQQNQAVTAMMSSATQQINIFQENELQRTNQDLNWGTDAAVPGVMATDEYPNTSYTSNTDFANANFNQQMANASAAVLE